MDDCRSQRRSRLAIAAFAAVLATASPALAQWPEPALRSGPWLPPPRDLAVALDVAGAWVPEMTGLTTDDTGLLQGRLTWNLAPWEEVGLFGRHGLGGMWWSNLTLLNSEHEIGLRWLASDVVTLEGAYLGHRTEKQWISGNSAAVGGIRDHGAELSGWAALRPHSRIRLELHLLGRWFRVYLDHQGVAGGGARLSLLFGNGQAAVLELHALWAYRADPREGVEHASWNVIGELAWRSRLGDRFGLQLGARLATNLLVGEVPMLELKRSMIGEPMAMGVLGCWFSI
ncbi:MAG TPA: hypothetical protein VM285_14235 [Polyangia bacterium]|nr:hypothetical protein [Polyangia bacterium]